MEQSWENLWTKKEMTESINLRALLSPSMDSTAATKAVFLSAIRFAMLIDGPCPPPFGPELKSSAQEQVEFMLVDDSPSLVLDHEVKSAVRTGLTTLFESFQRSEAETETLQSLSDLEWASNIVLPKLNLMRDFVLKWAEISAQLDPNLNESSSKTVLGMAARVLDAVAYGNVIIPAPMRVALLGAWIPFVRKAKPVSGSDMGDYFWEGIEGSIVAMVLSLPSSDQAEILGEWMRAEEEVRYPDLSEAFELWCYRTKSAKRRFVESLNGVRVPNNASMTL